MTTITPLPACPRHLCPKDSHMLPTPCHCVDWRAILAWQTSCATSLSFQPQVFSGATTRSHLGTKRHGNSVSMNAGGLWRLRSEVKRLLQHRIHDLPELFAAKSWSKPGRTNSGAFVAAKSVHPNGLVAGTRVNRAPKQLFRLCVIPPHGLSEGGPKTSC